MSNSKSREVQIYPITPNTRIFRSCTWDRLKFEIEYALKKGTTVNSYLIEGEKTALISPPGESFTEIFITELVNRIDLKQIDYLILGHVNPNRLVTINEIYKRAPQITFVCSNPGAKSLKSLFESTYPETIKTNNLNILAIKGEETLDLGEGHRLEFIPTPNPRFPDHLCTYDTKTQILFTEKLFGAHVCKYQVLDEGWNVYNEDRKYYFDCIIAPYAGQVSKTLARIKEKEIKIYGVGHGPLVKYGLKELTSNYQTWLSKQKSQEIQVALIYASAYGNTASLAGAIARGITKAGVGVESINAEYAEAEEIKAAIEKCAGFIFGSPTLGGHAPTQIQTALGITLAAAEKTKLAGVFGSFGWSGEAIDLLESKFQNAGYRFGFETIRVKFKPTELTLKTCEEAGTDFAQALRKKQKSSKPKALAKGNEAGTSELALGRIVGSLCVVTTIQDGVKGGMLASWVSQATFNPLGLTVAVAKDRAIESLLYTGSEFVLNIMAEGRHSGLMKHFLKPFAPGEDRFVEIEWEEGENGSPILKESLAYLECIVSNRMECGDHWLVYGVAKKGKLLDDEGITAVHHRKSGSYY